MQEKAAGTMENLKRKRKIVIIFLTIAYVWIALGTIGVCFARELDSSYSSAFARADSFVQSYDYMISQIDAANGGLDNDIDSRAKIIESARKSDPDAFKPATYGTGYIVKLENGELDAPAGFPENAVSRVASIMGEKGRLVSDDMLIRFTRIKDAFYYVEIDDEEEEDAVTTEELGVSSALSGIATVSGCEFLLIEGGETITPDTYVFAGTNELKDCQFISDTEINDNTLKRLNSEDSSEIIAKVRGKIYLMRSMKAAATSDGYQYSVLALIPIYSIFIRALQQSAMPLIIAMIICIALCVWILSIYRTVRDNVLTSEQRKMYAPVAVRKKMVAAVAICSVLVFLSSLFIFSLDSLFVTSFNQSTTLNEYFKQVNDDRSRADRLWQASQDRYTGNARLIAGLLDDHRELQNTAWLRKAANIFDADYIIIYDTNGDEVVSSARYRGLHLGKDQESSTYDFRRLLRGVPYISHAGITDELTGLTRDMYGISLRYLGNDKSYGALIMAADSSDHPYSLMTDIEETATTMAPEKGVIFGVDPESGLIKYSSSPSLKDANMKDVCPGLTSYEGGFMGFVEVMGTDYYLSSSKFNRLVYYCGEPEFTMFEHVGMNALDSTLRFFAITVILALILLSGYNQKKFDEYAAKTDSRDVHASRLNQFRSSVATASGSNLSRKQTAFLEHRYSSFLNRDLTPGERVLKVIQLLILIFSLSSAFFIALDKLDARGATGSNAIEYIMHGNWDRGFNLFSVTAILFLICSLVVWMYILKAAESLIYGFVSAKGRSTFMLVSNMLFYAAVIVVIFLSLGYLGVDARALVASAGIAGLAISLGARDLIADVLSGILLLIDNTYNVGDIVEIGGFRGEVVEIGIRSTRVIGRGDNVKTIRNSAVGDVINYSKLNSWYALLLTIDSSQSLSQVEKILEVELPKISAKHPEMVSGPDYRGVDSIKGDKTTLLILTECSQKDYDKVQLIVNREVRSIFKTNNITLY